MATKEDLVKIKNVLSSFDVIEACTKEPANAKWKFYKRTNVTVPAVLLRDLQKTHSVLSNLRRESKKTIQRQPLSL